MRIPPHVLEHLSKRQSGCIVLAYVLSACAGWPSTGLAQKPPPTIKDNLGKSGRLSRGVLGHGFDVYAGPTPKVALMQSPAIRDELQLTPEQRGRLDESIREFQGGKARLVPENWRVPAQSGRPAQAPKTGIGDGRYQSYMATRRRLAEEFDAAVLAIPDAGQRARLEQIQLQSDGFAAFSRKDLQEKLGLTPDQVARVERIVMKGRERMWHLSAVPAPSARAGETMNDAEKRFDDEVEKSRAAVVKERSERLKEIGKVLNETQLKAYRRLAGNPFDFMKLSRESGRAARYRPHDRMQQQKATATAP